MSLIAVLGGIPISCLALVGAIRIQDVNRRFDRPCDDIRCTADRGASCWLSVDSKHYQANEARIVGNQELINSSVLLLGKHLNSEYESKWAARQERLFAELTGGKFMERDCKSEPDRARLVQIEMGTQIADIRNFQHSTMKWRRLLAIALKHK